MIANKVNFLHIRKIDSDGDAEAMGGYTVAWTLDENQNILVGVPARCRDDEHFNKRIGRDYAQLHLHEQEPLAVIEAKEVHAYAVKATESYLKYAPLSPEAVKKIVDGLVIDAYHSLATTVTNSLLEAFVREALSFYIDQTEYAL